MLLSPFDISREKTVAGWLRIVFFSAILFNHTVKPPWEFLDERMWVVWAQTLRDFGAIGFFIVAGVSLKGKMLASERVRLPNNLTKLAIAAAALAAFDMVFEVAKGAAPGPFRSHFYTALYDTNLWFFIAYALAGPLLLSVDRKGAFWTGICCLGFAMFPAKMPLISPYILQTVSLAFVAMAIGAELYGRQASPVSAFVVAGAAFLARVWLDDYGYPAYPALDVALRLVYGVACFLLFKSLADRLCRRLRPPGWANYLFVPYIIQFPVVIMVTVFATALFTWSVHVNMQPIFLSFHEWLGFRLTIFGLALLASFTAAWLLRRYEIRV
jgi:hypothetical protein